MRKPFRRTAAIAALVLALSGMTAVAANAGRVRSGCAAM